MQAQLLLLFLLLPFVALRAGGGRSYVAAAAKASHCRPDLPGCCPKQINHVMVLHIEKTGGTSLREFLMRTLRKYFQTNVPVICNYLKNMPYQCSASTERGGNSTCNQRNFDYYNGPIANGTHFSRACKLTSSHHDHRIIDTMPREVLDTTMLITNFRDPASRLVSHYHMLRRHMDSKALNMTMVDYYLRDPDGVALSRNRMSRMLGGEFCCRDGKPVDYASQSMFKKASSNLDKFCVVGLTSNVQDTFSYIEHVLNMRTNVPPKNLHWHNNSGKYGPVSEDVLSRLKSFNQHDMNLFKQASKRFAEQMAVLNGTPVT